SSALHVCLGVAHRVVAEMEDARGKHRIRAALEHALRKMLEIAGAAGGNHRYADRLGHRAREREVEAAASAVAVHAGEQDLACAARAHALGPLYGVEAGRAPSAVGIDLPALAAALGVDRHHDALRADDAGGLGYELRRLHGGRVDGHLVGAGVEQAPHIGKAAHAAADGERNEDLGGHGLDHVQQHVALIGARGDVEKAKLVRALAVVAGGDLHRVAGVAQPDEVDTLDHAARGHVEAGDDALGEPHGAQALPSALSAAAWAFFSSSVPA